MPVFKKKNSHKYVITSLKVMYSSLKAQESLVQISHDQFISKYLKLKLKREQPKVYFFVRNPYDRLVSGFENKLRSSPKERLQSGEPWEKSTALFFPLIPGFKHKSREELGEAIQSVSFLDFINFLPRIYLTDFHFKPQHFSLKLKGWLPHIKPDLVIKLEELDSDWLKSELGIDISIRLNVMDKKLVSDYFDEETRAIAQELYAKDFQNFKYVV